MTKLGDAWAEQYKPGMGSKQARAFKRGWEAAMNAAENAIIDSAPPINSELSLDGETGIVRENRVMTAYTEGFHDAWATISALGNEHRELVRTSSSSVPGSDG